MNDSQKKPLNVISVLRPGTRVLIGNTYGSQGSKVDPIEATIVALRVQNGLTVDYQVIWWDGRTRKSEWLESFEVTTKENTDKLAIGFKS